MILSRAGVSYDLFDLQRHGQVQCLRRVAEVRHLDAAVAKELGRNLRVVGQHELGVHPRHRRGPGPYLEVFQVLMRRFSGLDFGRCLVAVRQPVAQFLQLLLELLSVLEVLLQLGGFVRIGLVGIRVEGLLGGGLLQHRPRRLPRLIESHL